jgi:putative PIG3 family NAD(P)H quinone oxidoreductase
VKAGTAARSRHLEVVERHGAYASELREVPRPVPQAGEVLIRVIASGVNRADLSQIAGRYPPPPGEPETLGLEVSGEADGTGERVCALLAGGGHAEWVAAPAGQVFPAPAALDPVTAAGIPEAFLTAFVNLIVEGGLTRGDTVLVHAGASGVGLAAIQVARLVGARVGATTRTPGKAAAMTAAGADLVVVSPDGAVAADVDHAWGPASVNVVLDPIGRATLGPDLRLLATGGRVIHIATLSGPTAELDLSVLMKKRGRLIGSTLRARSREEKARLVARFREELLPAFDDGRLRVVVDGVFPATNAAEAFQRMRANQNVGKLLLDWTGERVL